HTSSTYIYTLSLHDALPISVLSGATGSRHRSHHAERYAARRTPRDCATRFAAERTRVGTRTGGRRHARTGWLDGGVRARAARPRSEEHTSELQSRGHLVCRL